MRFNRFLATIVAISFLFLVACSDSPQPAGEKKTENAKPAEPVTGLKAMYQMYAMARQWAPDAELFRARDLHIPEVPSTPGRSGAWEATFVSASKGAAKTFTYSVVEAGGNLHQGVFAGLEAAYSGPRGQERPFPINVVQKDSDKAYQVAAEKGSYYAKEHPKMPVFFLLELTPAHSDPVWRVVWGESVATSGYSILVNAATGEFLQALR